MSEWTERRHEEAKSLSRQTIIDNVGVMPYLRGALAEIERLQKELDEAYDRLEKIEEMLP